MKIEGKRNLEIKKMVTGKSFALDYHAQILSISSFFFKKKLVNFCLLLLKCNEFLKYYEVVLVKNNNFSRVNNGG